MPQKLLGQLAIYNSDGKNVFFAGKRNPGPDQPKLQKGCERAFSYFFAPGAGWIDVPPEWPLGWTAIPATGM